MVESKQNDKHFISTHELHAMIDSGKPLRIIDCSVNLQGEETIYAYFREHIHGARFLDLKLARDHSSQFPFMMPSKDFFIMIARSLDIRKSHTVVTYDGGAGLFANRGALMLTAFGHPDVRVLDGGLAKWKADGMKVEASKSAAKTEDYDYQCNGLMVKGFEEICSISQSNSAQIIDVRPGPAYASGKIPNAINVPAGQFANPDGTLKSSDELKKVFENAGVDLSKDMVFSCGMGVAATVGYLAAGRAGAIGHRSVYDGSYTEYAARTK